MSFPPVQEPKARFQARASRRAPMACLRCRHRKVRCDVARNGRPCMNCDLDGESCMVTKKGSRWTSNAPWRVRYSKDDQDIQIKDAPARHPSCPTVPQLHTQPSPTASPGCHSGDDDNSSPRAQNDILTESERVRYAFDISEHGQTIGDNASTILTQPTLEHPSRQPNMIVYCTYSFILRADVFFTPVHDIQFLDSEGCFDLPTTGILDQFLIQYFSNVHPLLPMLTERDFWDAHAHPNPPHSKMLSLLLVQAMLFAACSFVPLKTINLLGYNSIRSARSAFYRKCKLIHDASIEPSKVAKAQAALLLTYWNPPLNADSQPNTMWLMIAIENAKRCHADRHSDILHSSSLPINEKSALRRLWWCCIIRDRILPLGLRRCIQITPSHFNLEENMNLGCTALSAEIRQSRVYDDDTKQTLSRITEQIVKLSVVLTDILLLAFPLKTTAQSKDMLPQIKRCKRELAEWYNNSSFLNTVGGNVIADRAIILHINLMYTYYHWAAIVVCHFNMRSVEATQLERNQRDDISNACRQARISTIRIVESLERLNQSSLTKWLPISIAAYAAFPLAIHIFYAACPDTSGGDRPNNDQRRTPMQKRLNTLIKTMKILHEQYDGVGQVIKSIRHIVEHVNSCAPKYIIDAATEGEEIRGDSELALRVSLAMDWILSSGRSSDGEEFASYLGALFHQPDRKVSPPEILNEPSEVRSENPSEDYRESAPEEPRSNWMITTPSSLIGETQATSTDVSSGPTYLCEPCPEDGGERDWGQERDLDGRIDRILEDSGELSFDDLFAVV